jgi:acyl-CoA thioesterase-1
MKIICTLMAAATLYGADTRPVIVCFGDSLTAGFGLDSGQSYPSLLQRELDRRGYKYRVENLGVSGDTTQDGLARVSNALALKPAIAVIELGANDGLRGQPVAGIERNLGQIIEAFQKADEFQAAKVNVLLAGITLPPNYGPDYIARFAAIYPKLAAKYKVRLLDFLLAGVAGNPRLMQQDGLHPNAEGTRTVAATVFKALEPMLKK